VKDTKNGSYFSVVGKIWMIVGLCIKMTISLVQFSIEVKSDNSKSMFSSTWLLKNFNGYIDIFLIGPVLILLIMPVNAMGLEWFSIVLLLCGGRKDEEMEEKKVEKTFQKLKTSFICISSFMFLVWFTRICLHWWTANLGGVLADSTPNFWCEDTGKRTDHKS
jgi:hypothetical protein